MTAIANPARPSQRGRAGRVILYVALSVGIDRHPGAVRLDAARFDQTDR